MGAQHQILLALYGGFINSIQSFSITISAASSTQAYTLPTTIGSTCSLHISGWRSSNGSISGVDDVAYLTLSGQNVSATRNGTTGTLVVNGYAIDWHPSAVKTVQMGTIQITSTNVSNTAVLGTAITTTNAAVQWNGVSSTIAGSGASVMTRLNLTAAGGGTVTVTRVTGTSATITTAYCVIEWQSGFLNQNTQETTASQAGSGTGASATLGSAVVMAQTWLVNGGFSSTYSSSWNGQFSLMAWLAGTTTVTMSCATATTNKDYTTTAVEFKAAKLAAAERGHATEIKHATDVFADATITSLDTTKAIANYLGWNQTTGSSALANLTFCTLAFQSATALREQRNTASNTVGTTPSWEALPFIF